MQQRTRYRRFTLGFLYLGLLVGAALLAGPAQAATSNGPYYAEPAWDQKLPAATRFIVLTDWSSGKAVLDRETGLVWEQSPAALEATWFNARATCANLKTGGRMGWRLPSMAELASLIDPSVALPGPTLPAGHPFSSVSSLPYWSATADAGSPTDGAWGVFFGDAAVGPVTKGSPIQVWCVRGGMNAEAY